MDSLGLCMVLWGCGGVLAGNQNRVLWQELGRSALKTWPLGDVAQQASRPGTSFQKPQVPPTLLTISTASEGVPKAMVSSSFCEGFSGTCMGGSWLGTSPRGTGCCIFAVVFTRASVSSKLDLRNKGHLKSSH